MTAPTQAPPSVYDAPPALRPSRRQPRPTTRRLGAAVTGVIALVLGSVALVVALVEPWSVYYQMYKLTGIGRTDEIQSIFLALSAVAFVAAAVAGAVWLWKPKSPRVVSTPDDSRRTDSRRTDNAALAALVLALTGFSVPALIVSHQATIGGKRTAALVFGWLGVLIGVAGVVTFLALASYIGTGY